MRIKPVSSFLLSKSLPLAPALALSMLAGCATPGYRLARSGEVLDVRLAWSVIIFDLLLVLGALGLAIYYRRILARLTGGEVDEDFSLGRVFMFLTAAFLAGVVFYPHWIYRIRIDENGVSKRTSKESVSIPWNEMVMVRNNLNLERATPKGIVKIPRLEIVGSHDEVIYIEEEEVGFDLYPEIAGVVGNRYYGRPRLIDGPPTTEEPEETSNEKALPDLNAKAVPLESDTQPPQESSEP